MRRLLFVFSLWTAAAFGSAEDYASPLSFGLDIHYSQVKYSGFFVDPLTAADVAPAQSGAGLYFEWLPITRWGKLGLGVGYQYVFNRTVTYSSSDTSKMSANVIEVGATYRLDYFLNQYVVPYGRFALAFVFPHENATVGGVEVKPSHSMQKGTEVAFGGEVLLDWLEPRSAANLDRDQGINNLYLFGEYIKFTSPSGASADLSYSGFRAGMRAEF